MTLFGSHSPGQSAAAARAIHAARLDSLIRKAATATDPAQREALGAEAAAARARIQGIGDRAPLNRDEQLRAKNVTRDHGDAR